MQIRTFLVDAQEFETLAAFGDKIEPAVGIFFHDGDDFSGASHFGEVLFDSPHHAEGLLPGKAIADHFFITRLENVQRQGHAWEQNDIERKQGNQGVQGDLRGNAAD